MPLGAQDPPSQSTAADDANADTEAVDASIYLANHQPQLLKNLRQNGERRQRLIATGQDYYTDINGNIEPRLDPETGGPVYRYTSFFRTNGVPSSQPPVKSLPNAPLIHFSKLPPHQGVVLPMILQQQAAKFPDMGALSPKDWNILALPALKAAEQQYYCDKGGNVTQLTVMGYAVFHPSDDIYYDLEGKAIRRKIDCTGRITISDPDADAPLGPAPNDARTIYKQNRFQAWAPAPPEARSADSKEVVPEISAATHHSNLQEQVNAATNTPVHEP